MRFISHIKLFVMSLLQDRFIFRPYPSNVDAVKTAEEYSLPETTTISIETEDNDRLTLWVKQPENPNGIMFILFHGNTGHWGDVGKPSKNENYNREYRLKLLKEIIKNGNGFVAVSNRGYGSSTGRPSEENFAKDKLAVAKFLEKENYPKLIIFGESLGATNALKMNETLDYKNILAVVIVASFTNLVDKTKESYPEFKDFDLTKVLHHAFDNKNTLENTSFKGKFLLFHPVEDQTTPFHHSEELLKRGEERGLDIKLFPLENCGHITWNASEILDTIKKEIQN